MEFRLINDVLMERDNPENSWNPVPVHRIQEAIEKISKKKPHAIKGSGKLSVKRV